MVPKHVAVVDTETTDKEAKNAKIVEFAMYSEHFPPVETLVNPGCPIPPETSAIHHICDTDVVDALPLIDLGPFVRGNLLAKGVTVIVAHNCEYDKTALGFLTDFEWICTYKAALWVWPDAPSHKNEALCYWLNLGDNGRKFNQGTHSALHDAKRTYLLLNELLKHATLDQLIAWTRLPKEIKKLPFGKHVGKTWAEVDYGYLKWMTSQADMDPDMVYHAKAEMKKRYG